MARMRDFAILRACVKDGRKRLVCAMTLVRLIREHEAVCRKRAKLEALIATHK